MNKQLQTLKGFRDFLPKQKRERDYVRNLIVEAFELAGFEPIETPTLEYKETIMGKYGDEADKLVYEFADRGGREVALRYDQTVPTARLIAQYQYELPMPFRRYQIQNVFRADKPQQGRYREFTQCDIDIFGSSTVRADAEILAVTYNAFRQIGFKEVELRCNDRTVLKNVLSPLLPADFSLAAVLQSIDKLDKQSVEEVKAELVSKGLNENTAGKVLVAINEAQISDNLQDIFQVAQALGVPAKSLVFDSKLARGLDYYTGMIFEITIPGYDVGSLGGGGRYDNLINDLSGVEMPAVGVGIGFDRTVEAALQLDLIPQDTATAQVLVTVFDDRLQTKSAEVVSLLRQQGVATELYPAGDKLGKQLKYASKSGIPFVVIVGEEEAAKDVVTLRNMISGTQNTYSVDDLVGQVKK